MLKCTLDKVKGTRRQRRELTLKIWQEEEDVAKAEEEALRQEESRRGWTPGSQRRSPTRKWAWPLCESFRWNLWEEDRHDYGPRNMKATGDLETYKTSLSGFEKGEMKGVLLQRVTKK